MSAGSEAGTSLAARNIGLLAAAQAIVGSSQPIVMAVGALTAANLAPDPALATLPVTVMILALAASVAPATFIIHGIGRTRAFMLGAALAIPAGILACLAVVTSSFWLFCLALALVGAAAAFSQQYRFAVADSVPSAWKARAISLVMLGGVGSAFLGPALANFSKDWVPGSAFAATYLILSALAVIGVVVLAFTRLAATVRPQKGASGGRPLGELLRTREIVTPILAAMASYALMTFVMVAAPLSMVLLCGHSTEAATTAIQWHLVAMFAPSFVTGSIISRIGAPLVAGTGLLLILLCALINLNGITVAHFNLSLILLGLGWNFGFIGATAMLTSAYRPEEAARVQALNEQLVFGAMAIASIGSGVLLQLVGWEAINFIVIPVALVAIAALAWTDLSARRRLA